MNDINTFFGSRRTIRKYSEKLVDLNKIDEMIALAAQAPTTGGMQLYSVVVTSDPIVKSELAISHFNQPASNAPLLLTFCADFNRFIKWCDLNNAKHGFSNFQSFVSAALDTTIIAQQFCTIAEMNGLGCCYLGTTTYNADGIAQTLKLPKYVIPITTLSVGYPDDDTPKAERLPKQAIIHHDFYNDYFDEDIRTLYKEKESLEVNVKFVEDNNKQNLAQVYSEVRYPKESNEKFSKIFLDFIEKQGFHFND